MQNLKSVSLSTEGFHLSCISITYILCYYLQLRTLKNVTGETFKCHLSTESHRVINTDGEDPPAMEQSKYQLLVKYFQRSQVTDEITWCSEDVTSEGDIFRPRCPISLQSDLRCEWECEWLFDLHVNPEMSWHLVQGLRRSRSKAAETGSSNKCIMNHLPVRFSVSISTQ